MPGRRRKKHVSQLPALRFVESPVYQPTPRLSPEAVAADNPVTAREVPVADLTDDSLWVSPQFPRTSVHRSGRSKTRQHSTRLRHKSEDTGGVCLSKFESLQFVVTKESMNKKNRDRFPRQHVYSLRKASKTIHENSCDRHTDTVSVQSSVLVQSGSENTEDCQSVCDQVAEARTERENCSPPSPHFTRLKEKRKSAMCVYDKECCLNAYDDVTQTPPRGSKPPVILAMDTPEYDYGLTHRQRQLKYGLRHTMARSLSAVL